MALKLPQLGHRRGRHTITPTEPPGAMSTDDRVADEDVLFHDACAEGDLVKVQRLLSEAPQNQQPHHTSTRSSIIDRAHPVTGATPLCLAVGTAARQARPRSTISTVKFLLEQGASVNLCAPGGDTPLVAACGASNPRVAHILLRFGAQPNQPNSRCVQQHTPRRVPKASCCCIPSSIALQCHLSHVC